MRTSSVVNDGAESRGRPRVQLLRESWPDRPEMGPAVSRALLDRVAAGEIPDTIRLSRPGRVVAFGRQDVLSAGYTNAVLAARDHGYEAMERLAGGRAAAYFEGTLSLTQTIADPEPPKRTKSRFDAICEAIMQALAGFGIDARVGEVPGEYCPGAYSVNGAGRVKLAGVGQRMIRGAAHVGAVIVVDDSAELRRVLEPVYSALDLRWRPDTTGSVAEATPPGSPRPDVAAVEAALIEKLSGQFDLDPAQLDSATLERAESIAGKHRSPSPS